MKSTNYQQNKQHGSRIRLRLVNPFRVTLHGPFTDAVEKMYIILECLESLRGQTCLANCQIKVFEKNMNKIETILYIRMRSHKIYHKF